VKTAAAIAGILVLAACAHSRAPHVTPADAERAQLRWPGITAAELDHGRSLFVGHCGTCHLPPKPSDYAPEAWPGHVSEMRERAGLTFEDQTLIERYVVTMATDSTTAGAD
jgi:cytochrome c5